MNPLIANSTNNSLSPGEFLQENKDDIYVWIKNINWDSQNMIKEILIVSHKILMLCTLPLSMVAMDQLRKRPVFNEELTLAFELIVSGYLITCVNCIALYVFLGR